MTRLLRRLRYLLQRDRHERELDDELRFHLEMKRQELESRGLDRAAAALTARRALGKPAAHPRPRARRLDRAVAAERAAGRPLRAADAAQAPGVHCRRDRDARARHRCKHGHLQRGQHRAADAVALPGFGPARPYRAECRRTDDVGWSGATGARCPGYRAAPVLPLADPVPLPRRGLRHHERDADRAGRLRAAGRRRGVCRHVRDAGRATGAGTAFRSARRAGRRRPGCDSWPRPLAATVRRRSGRHRQQRDARGRRPVGGRRHAAPVRVPGRADPVLGSVRPVGVRARKTPPRPGARPRRGRRPERGCGGGGQRAPGRVGGRRRTAAATAAGCRRRSIGPARRTASGSRRAVERHYPGRARVRAGGRSGAVDRSGPAGADRSHGGRRPGAAHRVRERREPAVRAGRGAEAGGRRASGPRRQSGAPAPAVADREPVPRRPRWRCGYRAGPRGGAPAANDRHVAVEA